MKSELLNRMIWNGLFWVVGWDRYCFAGIYDTINHSFPGKTGFEFEGLFLKQGFFKCNDEWYILSEFGEEDGMWEIKIYELRNGLFDYIGVLSMAQVKKTLY